MIGNINSRFPGVLSGISDPVFDRGPRPFGAGTVFDPLAGNRILIRFALALRRSRTGQLVSNVVGPLFAGDGPSSGWRGMAMFLGSQVRADATALETTYRHFEANLRDICRIARNAMGVSCASLLLPHTL